MKAEQSLGEEAGELREFVVGAVERVGDDEAGDDEEQRDSAEVLQPERRGVRELRRRFPTARAVR